MGSTSNSATVWYWFYRLRVLVTPSAESRTRMISQKETSISAQESVYPNRWRCASGGKESRGTG